MHGHPFTGFDTNIEHPNPIIFEQHSVRLPAKPPRRLALVRLIAPNKNKPVRRTAICLRPKLFMLPLVCAELFCLPYCVLRSRREILLHNYWNQAFARFDRWSLSDMAMFRQVSVRPNRVIAN